MKQYTPAGEILKKEYLNWLKENGVESVDSAKSYLTPLNIKYPGSEDTYFDVIAYYAAKGLPVELGKVMGHRQTSVDEFLRFSRKCGIDGT